MKTESHAGPILQELIVVEGKNDAHAIRQALGQVDVIWTEGFGLSEEKIQYIAEMAHRQGVIICTDPDYVGEQIRQKISKRVPTAQHVYLARASALNKQGNDIGWENADKEEIRKAFGKILKDKELQNVSQKPYQDINRIEMQDLIDTGLVGQEGSAAKRSKIGKMLGIGDTNAKQFLYRAKRFGLEKEDLMKAIQALVKVE